MEADMCVKNSRHKLADIMETQQVSLSFRDGDHDEFITKEEILAAVDNLTCVTRVYKAMPNSESLQKYLVK
jgi:hypothetical protein